ncbi:hypothetical protein [Micromonospora sp. ATCC 39149]|uniref:Uncharacterized protein n=1 Tax=Micromonospora carbonacea TaxID=47853 RepID=A0A7D5YD94_9ACTN|nr:hypothetical protein [Micromonospora sp. ATCC 39149]QLJ98917.1 hypothetical protein HZU44_01515 [Micromonospora carbonacea]
MHLSRRGFLFAGAGTALAAMPLLTAAPATAAPTHPGTAAGRLPADALDAGLDAITEAGMVGALAEALDGRDRWWRGASGVADLDTGRPMGVDRRGADLHGGRPQPLLPWRCSGAGCCARPSWPGCGPPCRSTPRCPEAGGYGLGLLWLALPGGRFWGHDGLVFGHATISLHAPDGSRQVTLGTNVTHYQVPGEPDPIGAATSAFLVTALSGSANARGAGAARTPAPLPATPLPGGPALARPLPR